MTGRRVTFILRLTLDPGGQVTGVVEQVRTREKACVGALSEVSVVLAGMLEREVIKLADTPTGRTSP